MHKRFIGIFLLIFLISACNYPQKIQDADGISGDDLRQTLAAQSQIKATESSGPPDSLTTPPVISQTSPTPGIAPTLIVPVATLQADPSIYEYYAQSGDTLGALEKRFEVSSYEILSNEILYPKTFIPNGELLFIPNRTGQDADPMFLLPDSEVINSPSAASFDLHAYVEQAGGYLSNYSEHFNDGRLSGSEIVERVAMDNSVNPRVLLSLLEFRSGWVFGDSVTAKGVEYPMGFVVQGREGLYKELVLTANYLNTGYYGWRSGTVTDLGFQDGRQLRIHPGLNAGSVGIQVLFSKWYRQDTWSSALYGEDNIVSLHTAMFGDPWLRAATVEPLFTSDVSQPEMALPFVVGERWSMTGGPHAAWNSGSPRGAIDLAPVTGEAECAVSYTWVTASAPGLITRSERNLVVIDLDGDGYEQTGWNVVYFHIADKERIDAGSFVDLDDQIGHPSCEGGRSTGTHVHIARKYNGEWLLADGPLPFILSGWLVYADDANYKGGMRKDGQEVIASPVGPRTSIVVR
jgi:hypothetical protein